MDAMIAGGCRRFASDLSCRWLCCRDQQVEEKRERTRRAAEEERAADAAMEVARQRALTTQLVNTELINLSWHTLCSPIQ